MSELNTEIKSVLAQKNAEVWSIAPDASVYQAIEMMAAKSVGALLVMQAGKLNGILSERDYARKVILQGKSSRDTPVSEIMSSPVITVTTRHTIQDCMSIMTAHRVRHLPVTRDDQVIAVISIGDLVNWVMLEQSRMISDLKAYISG